MNKRKRLSKKMNVVEGGAVRNHQQYIKTYRHHVQRVLRTIRDGVVTEDDLDRLTNFCQMAVTLMEGAPMRQIEDAWRTTELLAFEHADLQHEVVLGDTVPKVVENRVASLALDYAKSVQASK